MVKAIEIIQLVKEYRNGVRALDGLSLEVGQGEIFALLGPNGAGKSSLINILTTLYRPTAGKALVLGQDIVRQAAWVRSRIACVAQRVSVDEHLSLMENMMFQSRLYKIEPQVARKRIAALLNSFELAGYLKYPVTSYSGGVRRRLDIALNLVSAPEILFLDEPTVGLDVESRHTLWRMLVKVREQLGATIFLTTHYLEEADRLSDSICIMKDGREAARGTPAGLRAYLKPNMLRIGFPDAKMTTEYREALAGTGLVKFVRARGNCLLAGVSDSRAAFQAVNEWLMVRQVDYNAIEIVEPSLEDVFLTLTGSGDREEWVC